MKLFHRLVYFSGFLTGVLHASAGTWIPSTPNNSSWNDPANWSDDVVPGADATAGFGWKTDADRPVSSYYYIALDAPQQIQKLALNEWNTFPSPMFIGTERDRLFGYTLTLQDVKRGNYTSGSSYIVPDVILSGESTWFVHKGYNGEMTVRGSISGPWSLTKTGAGGTLILASKNTYTGLTTVSEGTLCLGDGTDPSRGSGVAGDIVSNGELVLDPARGDVLTVRRISGTGGVTKKGLGTVVFTGEGGLGTTGTFKITQHAWDNYGVGPIDCIVPDGVLAYSSYNINYNFDYLGSENLDLGEGSVSLTKYNGNDTERSIGVLKNTLTIGGPVGGDVKFTKTGRGTMVLKSASTYTGGTAVNVGTMELQASATLGTGDVSVGADASLILGDSAEVIDRIPDASALALGGVLVQNAPAMEAMGALTLKTGRATIKVRDAQATSGFAFESFAARESGNTTVFDLAGDSTVSFGKGEKGTLCTGAILKRGETASFAALDESLRVVPLAADGESNVKMDLQSSVTLPEGTYETLELCNNSGTAVTVTLGGTLVAEHGLLLSGSSPITVTGGTIGGNTAGESILLVANTAGVTLESPVSANNITFGGVGDLSILGNLTAAEYGNGYITVNIDGNIVWGQKNASCGAVRFFSGRTTFAQGGKLYESNSTGSGTRSYLRVGAGAVLDLNGVSAKSNSLTGHGVVTNGSETPCTLTCDWQPSGSNWQTFGATFAGNLEGNLSLVVTSGGYYAGNYTQTLSGENTLSGNVIKGGSGTLELGSRSVLGGGAFYVNSAKVNSSGLAVGTCTDYFFKSFTYGGRSSLDLTSGHAHLNAENVTITVGGNTLSLRDLAEESLNSSLVKAGTGTLRLVGTSTYTGSTMVSAGTLELAGDMSGIAITVAADATLRLSEDGAFHQKTDLVVEDGGKICLAKDEKHIVRSFVLAGEEKPVNVTYGAVGSGASVELDCFEGPGVLAFEMGSILVIR